MTRSLISGALAAALVAVACIEGPRPADIGGADHRLARLDRAFAERRGNPARAAELFAAAGPGPVLERVRLEGWLAALESSDGSVDVWREAVSFRMPDDLETRAVVGLAKALVADRQLEDAVVVLEGIAEHGRVRADMELLEIGDGPWRERAAARLAIAAPHRLRRSAPGLEAEGVAGLDPEARLDRSAAWSAAGSPKRAAAELRKLRFRGEEERRRILDLARHEVAAGNPARALAVLRPMSAADPEVQLVRGEAARRQGWQRYPRATARSSFLSCLESASRALAVGTGDMAVRQEALPLVVGCGTEAGRPDEAAAAWWQLEGSGWDHERRQWLGRRLGIALARRTGDRGALLRLASSMPTQERCLRFWAAVGSPDREPELRNLAEAELPDLYGQWALQILGLPRPETVDLAPTVVPSAPPATVAWLVGRDALPEAAAEWRRIRSRRGTWPAEGLAEAELAELRGRRMDVIRALRAAMPALGTVEMARVPANGVRAYLPLGWIGALRSAAAESGVEPWLLAGVARQESAFVAHARSPRAAKGVMQLLEGTARGHARALGLGRRPDLMDPEVNFRLGARQLRRLLDRFGAVEPTLAAYNAGETRARKWWSRHSDRYRFTEEVPIPETYNYIRRVTYLAEAYRLVYREEWETP